MDALELALKCSSLLIRSMSTRSTNVHGAEGLPGHTYGSAAGGAVSNLGTSEQWNESDSEKYFKDNGNVVHITIFIMINQISK